MDWQHLVLSILPLLNLFFVTWLAHRRKRADLERRRFYAQMRVKLGLTQNVDVQEALYGEKPDRH